MRNVESDGRVVFQSSERVHVGVVQRWEHDLPLGECQRLSRRLSGASLPRFGKEGGKEWRESIT